MVPNVAGSSPVDRPSFISMTTLEAFILGIIQGLTEFLPVSSSGHLELSQYLIGLQNLDQYVFFNLICHVGTLIAIILVYFSHIQETIFTDHTRLRQIILGTLPLFPLVLIMKPIKQFFDKPEYLGFCFLITAILLYLGIRSKPSASNSNRERPWRDALMIGLFQAFAILPGVSRSGSTISAGRMLGWQRQDAISFSFLLAIPAILGGVVLESFHVWKLAQLPNVGWTQYVVGFSTSLVVGYFALKLLMKLAAKDRFIYFVWYCLFIGIATTFYFNW